MNRVFKNLRWDNLFRIILTAIVWIGGIFLVGDKHILSGETITFFIVAIMLTIYFWDNGDYEAIHENNKKQNMLDENLKKLNNYFKDYIDKMLIRDIELLKKNNDRLNFSYPYILLVCSCIDLFGGIEKGFTRGGERFKWFVIKWMGKINTLYNEESLAYLIYDSWRCGISHQATLKKGFGASSFVYDKDKHLNYIKDKEIVYIHPIQFADDFIEAQKLYRQYIESSATNSTYIELLNSHLSDMINEDNNKKNQALEEFVKILQSRNLVFDSSEGYSSENSFITQLPEDYIEPEPSKMPEEEDLK